MKVDILNGIATTVKSVYRSIVNKINDRRGLKDDEWERLVEWVNSHYEGPAREPSTTHFDIHDLEGIQAVHVNGKTFVLYPDGHFWIRDN